MASAPNRPVKHTPMGSPSALQWRGTLIEGCPVTFAGRSSGLNGAVVSGGPGRSTLTVALNQRTRDAIRRANVRLTVRITVIDGAGNRSRQTRVLRSQTLGQRRG